MEGTTYSALSSFAQTWGLLIFVALFAGVLVYALRPGKQKEFDRAARQPLRDDDERDPEAGQAGHDTGHKDEERN